LLAPGARLEAGLEAGLAGEKGRLTQAGFRVARPPNTRGVDRPSAVSRAGSPRAVRRDQISLTQTGTAPAGPVPPPGVPVPRPGGTTGNQPATKWLVNASNPPRPEGTVEPQPPGPAWSGASNVDPIGRHAATPSTALPGKAINHEILKIRETDTFPRFVFFAWFVVNFPLPCPASLR